MDKLVFRACWILELWKGDDGFSQLISPSQRSEKVPGVVGGFLRLDPYQPQRRGSLPGLSPSLAWGQFPSTCVLETQYLCGAKERGWGGPGRLSRGDLPQGA